MAKQRGRGQGEGSIFERSDGRWCGVINIGWQGGRRVRKYIYGATQADVVDRMTDARKSAKDGTIVMDERQTVDTFLNRWLEDCARPSVRPATYRRYADLIRLHIVPEIGRVPLAKLAPQQVQGWLNRKCGAPAASTPQNGRPAPSGLSARTVQHLHAVLRVALGQALRWGLVARNVATLVNPPRAPHKEIRPLSPEEATKFLVAIQGDRIEALYSVALACGLRRGEALGLRWEDLDLDAGTLKVRRALQRIGGTLQVIDADTGKLGHVGGKVEVVEPKTARSRRTIALPDICVKVLRAHRIRQIEERLVAGSHWKETGFVFTSTIGTPLDPDNVRTRFKAILKGAGLPPQRFHDLRHTAASLLLAQGVHPRVVMEMLGHSQIALTMNTYSHVMPTVLRDAADRMDAILTGTR